LQSQSLAPNRLVITPDLAEFNRRYTISHLPSQKIDTPAEAKPTDYAQLLIDGAELIESHLLLALPDSLRRVDGGLTTVGEFGILGLSKPKNVQSRPPLTLDSERRLLQFSADYRIAADVMVPDPEVSWWGSHFAVQLRRELHPGWTSMNVVLPVRASFHMIDRGDNTEQFSLASADIAKTDIQA
jgi:hypothetical protein